MNSDPSEAVIRPYEVRDRSAIRRIACDTANAGQPVETFLNDRELAADLLTMYYTDFEPGSAWVADQNGRVIGYLTGCRDTRRFTRIMAWRIMPPAICRAFARGTPRDPAFRRLVRRNLGIWVSGLFQQRVSLAEYPGHLHVNLDPAGRGRHIGWRLVERCLEQFRAWRISGLHAGVREDNEGARRFFERLGFVRQGRHPFLHLDARVIYSVILGKKLVF